MQLVLAVAIPIAVFKAVVASGKMLTAFPKGVMKN